MWYVYIFRCRFFYCFIFVIKVSLTEHDNCYTDNLWAQLQIKLLLNSTAIIYSLVYNYPFTSQHVSSGECHTLHYVLAGYEEFNSNVSNFDYKTFSDVLLSTEIFYAELDEKGMMIGEKNRIWEKFGSGLFQELITTLVSRDRGNQQCQFRWRVGRTFRRQVRSDTATWTCSSVVRWPLGCTRVIFFAADVELNWVDSPSP
jgi:hypothetical protein